MKIIGEDRHRPLGKGRFYPAGSVGEPRVGEIVSSYKREIAGTYAGVPPEAIHQSIPPGRHMVSTKVDGEQWFLAKDDDGAYLISPSGKVITGIEATEEAESALRGWRTDPQALRDILTRHRLEPSRQALEREHEGCRVRESERR
ncbi:MAG: hypothetical protein ACYC08_10485 [Armatimonadota bacterium]